MTLAPSAPLLTRCMPASGRILPDVGPPKAARLESLTAEVRLSPYDALQGVLVPVGIPVFVRCAACGGSGRDWYSLCLACQGHGMVETEHTIHVRIPPRAWEG